jgi:hypothetical protein
MAATGNSCLDASYQASVQLALWFQRRKLKCEKLTDDGRQVMAKAHIAFGKLSLKMADSCYHWMIFSIFTLKLEYKWLSEII